MIPDSVHYEIYIRDRFGGLRPHARRSEFDYCQSAQEMANRLQKDFNDRFRTESGGPVSPNAIKYVVVKVTETREVIHG